MAGEKAEKIKKKNLANAKKMLAKIIKKYKGMYLFKMEEYRGCRAKMNMTCKKHGAFRGSISNMTMGFGCPKCRNEQTNDLHWRKLAAKAQEKYGKKFILKKENFKGFTRKMKIRCAEHGDFYVEPHYFLRRETCPKCQKEGSRKASVLRWVLMAENILGKIYEYDMEYMKKNPGMVKAKCAEHGDFITTRKKFLAGRNKGCLLCGKKNDFEIFKNKVVKLYGNKYRVKEAVYTNAYSEIAVECPEHGEFRVNARVFLGGSGCPRCKVEQKKKKLKKKKAPNGKKAPEGAAEAG